MPGSVIGRRAREPASGNELNEGHLLLGLRRSLSLQMLNRIPAPLGFKPAWNVERPGDDDSQHEMGSDGGITGHYGSGVVGDQARWDRQAARRVAEALPDPEDMLRVWRADRCVQDSSASLYLQWIRRFRAYCERQGLDERTELTPSTRCQRTSATNCSIGG